MKKLCSLLCILVLCFVAIPAFATEEESGLGFWFEAQVASHGSTRLIGSYEKTLVGPLGFYALIEQEFSGYREFYVGPTLKPFDWLQVGIGIGKENIPETEDEDSLNSTRYNAFFSIEYEKIAIYGSFENGNGGPWHELRAVYNPTEKFGIGLMDEAFRGFGPRIELNIGKGVQLWGAILHNNDAGETTSVLAVNFSF